MWVWHGMVRVWYGVGMVWVWHGMVRVWYGVGKNGSNKPVS